MRTHVGYLNSICPKCFDRSYDNDWNGKSACGYQFPLHFMIDYGSEWDYTEELLLTLKQYDGLRLAGKYVGKQPEKLQELAHVQQLFMSRYKGFQFDFLKEFHSLEILELDYISITDLSGIEVLSRLNSLILTECRKLSSIAEVVKLNIALLKITLCNKIDDIEELSKLSTLRYFAIAGKILDNLDFLGDLTNLKYLNLNIRVADKNLDVLLGMKHLKRIGFKKSSFKKNDINKLREALPDCTIATY